MNLFSLAQTFPTEEHALAYLMKARWPDGVRCLGCDHDKCYLIETKGKTGKVCRLFECAECKLHFSATTNTLFHDSHLPLQKWFAAIALMVEAKKGISAAQVQRHIGVTYKTAWYLCHRIRQAMQEDPGSKIGGEGSTVEIDEMYVGGRRHKKGPLATKNNKVTVLGIAERGGSIHLQTVAGARGETVKPILDAKLSSETGLIVTDGANLYKSVIPKEKHKRTIHAEEVDKTGKTTMRTVEGAFSLFQRGIVGNYHKLSEWHMDRYLGEFCWRFNRRRKQPQLFDLALSNLAAKKPLPYKELTVF